jgi:hypothetical protein
MYEQPKTFDETKKLISSHVGTELGKYPLKFVAPAYFGARPQLGLPAHVNSGSASLLRLNGQAYVLTCWHVLEGYRQRMVEGPCIFQVGNCELDPLAQLKSESKSLDYALIWITDGQVKKIAKPSGSFDGKFFCELAQWPPSEVKEGDYVAFGGFPGDLRRAVSFDELSFGSYSSGATQITSARDDYFVCHFESEHWVSHGFEPEPNTIRGMSGAPVFAIRYSGAGIMTYDFVGHIIEFHEDFKLLYVRLARALPIVS